MSSGKLTINFQPNNQIVEVSSGTTILEAARMAGLELVAPCGGTGRCGRCLVKIFSPENNDYVFSLACKTIVKNNLFVEWDNPLQSLLGGQLGRVNLEPAVFLSADGHLEHREGFNLTTLNCRDKNILGLALDLGTTTLAGYLYDLSGGACLSAASTSNGQIAYGTDVITRMAYAEQSSGHYQELRRAIIQSINKLIADCCSMAGTSSSSIYELVIVGNTPMIHLLLQWPLESLKEAPFQPYIMGPVYIKAEELALQVAPEALCYFPPFIGGFIGSDALAASLACELTQLNGNVLLLDIGTNAEILLKSGDNLLAVSAPAGPALEGGNLSGGMIASPGAISRVTMDYEVNLEVIGDIKPMGICGSGVIDAIAEMIRLRIIRCDGSLSETHQLPPVTSYKIKNRLISGPRGEVYFKLADEIRISQRDIREIQLAKGAIAAGMELLLKEAGLRQEDISQILLAGGFGNYLNPVNAHRTGMLGNAPLKGIKQVGNTAGTGAAMMLLSYSGRKDAEVLSTRFKHLELANDPRYQDLFIKSLYFSEKECAI